LDTVKKPFKLSVDELASRLHNINTMMSLLTADGANPFTENQLKHKLFRMMPRPWQLRYVQQGNLLTAAEQTLERVRQFMSIQESSAKSLNDNKKDDDDLGPVTGKRARGRGGRFNRGGGNQSGQNVSDRTDNDNTNNNTTSRKRGREDGNGRRNNDCPFHGTHPWETCWGNEHGSNYRPDYVLPAPIVNTYRGTQRNNNNNNNNNNTNRNNNNNNGGNGGNNNRRSQQNDAHVMDETEDAHLADTNNNRNNNNNNDNRNRSRGRWRNPVEPSNRRNPNEVHFFDGSFVDYD
jgi:hypothetical protein